MIISGDPRVFARRNFYRLRHPPPKLEAPSAAHVRGSFLANASYTYLNEGPVEARAYLESEGYHMDDLSSRVAVVATKDGKTYVCFRGAQSQAENPAEHAMSERDVANVKRVLAGKRVHSDGMTAIHMVLTCRLEHVRDSNVPASRCCESLSYLRKALPLALRTRATT